MFKITWVGPPFPVANESCEKRIPRSEKFAKIRHPGGRYYWEGGIPQNIAKIKAVSRVPFFLGLPKQAQVMLGIFFPGPLGGSFQLVSG